MWKLTNRISITAEAGTNIFFSDRFNSNKLWFIYEILLTKTTIRLYKKSEFKDKYIKSKVNKTNIKFIFVESENNHLYLFKITLLLT